MLGDGVSLISHSNSFGFPMSGHTLLKEICMPVNQRPHTASGSSIMLIAMSRKGGKCLGI